MSHVIKKIAMAAAAATTLVATLSCSQDKSPKILVLYYSQTSNTKAVAEEICNRLGADIEEIVPVNPYDADFQQTIERCMKEREEGVVPEVKPLSVNVKDYDIIFLGYPVWFGTYAPPVAALLDNIDLAGKKVVPFCTFGSGGLDSSVKDLENKQPKAEILPGYGVRAARMDAVPEEIDRFLKEGGFIEGEYEKYDDFSEVRPATEEESAIFDAAVNGYPMLHAKAKNVSSRAVTNGTEYLFEAEDIPGNPAFADAPHTIKVYVLDLEGKEPVFTQVVR
ncbi:MAG: NAD(P)H-dependent oxidoreductase [Bacteroidales bacterium]|nr:NAD(P)H-dependent oxidoreductase [Bacteroidales bacterium]